jgi:DNA-binding transcriptional LysR family regulator
MEAMSQRLLSPREVDVLLALEGPTTFTAAAVELGITQSAVSRSVLQIEEAFGTELLNRGRHGCEPTDALKSILPRLRRARHALESISNEFQTTDKLLQGRIKIVGFRSATSILLPPIIASFMERHRQVRIALSTVREIRGGVQQQVLDGKSDFGITSMKPTKGLRSVLLGADRYIAVRRRQKPSSFVPSKERLVLWQERCSDRVPEILIAQRWKPLETMSVDSDTAVLGMVEHGGGFTIMPELATEPGMEFRSHAAYVSTEMPLGLKASFWRTNPLYPMRYGRSSQERKDRASYGGLKSWAKLLQLQPLRRR